MEGNASLEPALWDAIAALVSAIDRRNHTTGHSTRVASYAVQVAEALGWQGTARDTSIASGSSTVSRRFSDAARLGTSLVCFVSLVCNASFPFWKTWKRQVQKNSDLNREIF